MKWILLSKAKVKFNQLYLLASPDLERPCCGTLKESKITEDGVKHFFLTDVETKEPVNATYVAIIQEPK